MTDVNRVTLMGRVADAPDIDELDGIYRGARFRLVTEEWLTAADGRARKLADRHLVVVWGVAWRGLCETLQPGTRVAVIGAVNYRQSVTEEEVRYWTQVTVGAPGTMVALTPDFTPDEETGE